MCYINALLFAELNSSVDSPLQTQSEGIHLPPIAEVTGLTGRQCYLLYNALYILLAISTSSLVQSVSNILQIQCMVKIFHVDGFNK